MAQLLRVSRPGDPDHFAPRGSEEAFDLSWCRVGVTLTRGIFSKTAVDVLDGVSGRAPSGSLTAVLGPSGSGKSTLLSVLSGYRNKYRGCVLVNDKRVSAHFHRQKSCYVPQEIFLFPHLSVRETLTVAANLKLPPSVSPAEKKRRVTDILKTLNLLQSENTKTNKLSGGERRRVGIIQELVNNPPIIILDEPTSGLDSTLAYQCIDLLLKLASEGKTVICSIHQPNSTIFDLFHNIHVLSEGKCIYSGSRKIFTSYLSSCGLECPQYHNPADYALDIANNVLPGRNVLLSKQNDYWNREFQTLGDCQKISSMELKHTTYPTSFFNQFLVLLRRIFISTCNPVTILLYLVSEILLASLIGMVYRGSGNSSDRAPANLGFLALTIIIVTFAAILPTLLNFPSERIGILREYHNGWYSVTSYFLAKSIAELPINFIFPSIFVSLVYWLTGQSLEAWRFFYFVAFAVGLALNAQSIPIIFGSLFSDKVTVFLVPVICLPLLLFCNFFAINNPLPSYLKWITKVSPFALSYEGMLICVYGFKRERLECSQLCLFTPEFIVKILKIRNNDVYTNFAILGSSLIFLRIVGYLCLRYSVSRLK
ncbi:ATP-binding cassette sub-family G member 1-like isoform X1 [Centruroides vittatus]|uniref:ATP-binding cassette sub-family G member 1-like isoform X1 n=1 Tax=Centruroides vittatus TaxID=120091 RepID=UPI0035102640